MTFAEQFLAEASEILKQIDTGAVEGVGTLRNRVVDEA